MKRSYAAKTSAMEFDLMNMWLKPSLTPTTHTTENWTVFLMPDSWNSVWCGYHAFLSSNGRHRGKRGLCYFEWSELASA
jgi:hypothetical protein